MPVRARSRASRSSRNCAAVGLDRAQLVELGVVAVGDHAAFAQHRRRLGLDRRFQQRRQLVLRRKRAGKLREPRARERAQSPGRGRAAASTSRAAPRGRAGGRTSSAMRAVMRSTSAHSLSVSCRPRCGAPPAPPINVCHRIEPRGEHGAVAQRVVQRVAQPAAAHAGRAGVEQREERRRGLAAYGLGELEVAARRRIHAHVGALLLDRQRP